MYSPPTALALLPLAAINRCYHHHDRESMLMPVSLRAEREYLYVYRIYKGHTVNKSKCEAGGRPDYLLLITLYGSHKLLLFRIGISFFLLFLIRNIRCI